MTATDELRARLNARGIHWERHETLDIIGHDIATKYRADHAEWIALEDTDVDLNPTGNGVNVTNYRKPLTPKQAIEATLGREPWVSPTLERWHKSLRHDEIKSIGDAVEQLMYEVIEFGGDMGPNGNTYNGIDEGDVLTAGFINEWVERFESTLGRGTCRNISPKLGNDEFTCEECLARVYGSGGQWFDVNWKYHKFNFCPNCGRRVE